jgi:hypothetical protein
VADSVGREEHLVFKVPVGVEVLSSSSMRGGHESLECWTGDGTESKAC